MSRVIFAYGPAAEKTRPQDGVLQNLWMEKGLELTFVSIEATLSVCMAISDEKRRVEMARELSGVLIEMNAPDSVRDQFKNLFAET